MMEPNPLRKPKLHFDSALRPDHVTFDDAKTERRNFPWVIKGAPTSLSVGSSHCKEV